MYVCKPERLSLGMKKEQELILGRQARQSGGYGQEEERNTAGIHTSLFSHAFYSTGVGAKSVSQNLRPMSVSCQNWKEP